MNEAKPNTQNEAADQFAPVDPEKMKAWREAHKAPDGSEPSYLDKIGWKPSEFPVLQYESHIKFVVEAVLRIYPAMVSNPAFADGPIAPGAWKLAYLLLETMPENLKNGLDLWPKKQ